MSGITSLGQYPVDVAPRKRTGMVHGMAHGSTVAILVGGLGVPMKGISLMTRAMKELALTGIGAPEEVAAAKDWSRRMLSWKT